VAAYLSDEWLADVERALRQHASVTAAAGDLVVTHRVSGGPAGDRTFHIELRGPRTRVAAGEADAAHVTFTQDYSTAAAIARGELSAQAAFMAGRLRVGGDLTALVDHHRPLLGIDDALATVRASTTY
jgi:hypothetical protein